MIFSATVAALVLRGQATPSIEDFVQPKIQDLSITAKVVKADQPELRKINSDFGTSYRFDSSTIDFKEPFKLRTEATTEDTHIVFINNGPIQIIRVPRLHVNSRQNLATKPGRRQTSVDFGFLAPSLFQDLYVAKFVRWDRATGDAVFDLTYNPTLRDSSRSRVWLDPQKRYIVKREWYNQYNRQLATFYYESPQEFDGIWLPTRQTVRNVDNIVGGIVAYESIKVNTGLPDSLFE